MLEAAAISILTKALDFLFGEGSKILEERRERRKAQLEAEKPEAESTAAQTKETQPPDVTQQEATRPDTEGPIAQAAPKAGTADVVQQQAEKPSAETTTVQPTTEVGTSDVIQSKADALSALVDETAWRDSESEIRHLMSLLEIHTRNYHHAKEQYAKWGSALVPPVVLNTLIEEEDAVASTLKDLQVVLSKVYAKEIVFPRGEQK
jgi:hypothetical protein